MRKSLLFIPMLIYFLTQLILINGKSFGPLSPNAGRSPKFVTFNTNSGKIEMALDLSLPFITIPLEEKNAKGGLIDPRLKINVNTLGILSVLTLLTTLVFPWFRRDRHKSLEYPVDLHHYDLEHKRSNRGMDILYVEHSIEEILFENGRRASSCMQSFICWTVASATHSQNPSSIHKIIDAVSSHAWLVKATNSTIINEAVLTGRKVSEPSECTAAYKGCGLNQEIIMNILKLIGM